MHSDAMKTEPPSTAGSRRIEGLDGLRGVAAMVVVLLHSLLLSDSFVTPFADPRPTTSPGEAMWWLTHTPLHLPWEGRSPSSCSSCSVASCSAFPPATRG